VLFRQPQIQFELRLGENLHKMRMPQTASARRAQER